MCQTRQVQKGEDFLYQRPVPAFSLSVPQRRNLDRIWNGRVRNNASVTRGTSWPGRFLEKQVPRGVASRTLKLTPCGVRTLVNDTNVEGPFFLQRLDKQHLGNC
jgi:hypothetical protein